MAIVSVIVTVIIFLALFSVIPLIVWLVYKAAYDRHANEMLSEGKKKRNWLPPFAVILISFAAEIVILTGIVFSFRAIYSSRTSSSTYTVEAGRDQNEERMVRLNFPEYDTFYVIGGSGADLSACEEEIVITYADDNDDLYEITYRVSWDGSDAFSMETGTILVDVEDIDPASVRSVEVRGINENGEYTDHNMVLEFGEGAS